MQLTLFNAKRVKFALAEITADKEVKVMILTGVGKGILRRWRYYYMAGIKAPARPGQVQRWFGDYQHDDGNGKADHSCRQRYCSRTGLHIALAADIIIVRNNARFRESFVNIGLIAGFGGFYNLP